MFAQQNINNHISSSAHIEISSQYLNTNGNHLKQNYTHLPSCIVIGCKNGSGYSSPSVKYYQVPTINLNTNDSLSSIARQWYINTLREDLLDFILSNKKNSIKSTLNDLSSLPTPHYVCIEHFDEESFLLTANQNNSLLLNNQEQLMILKEDAVPSLFEIEVFQKMIAHQEQIALNQQKQLIQFNHQHQQQQQQQHQNASMVQGNLQNGQQYNHQKSNFQPPVSAKRSRMDPDTRAALMQRVPKAVKRTSILNMSIQPSGAAPPQKQNNSTPPPSTVPTLQKQVKAPKAVKHTTPRFLQNNNNHIVQLNHNSNIPITAVDSNKIEINKFQLLPQTPQQQVKAQKAVKHTSANILLPPPIMQSTKRLNKAIKHTGGGSNAYYQSLNNSIASPSQEQTVAQINNSANEIKPQTSSQPSTTKIPVTTTYVYKRILQQPEIDLNLECEDEEIILISAPTTPIPSPPPVQHFEENFTEILESKKEELSTNKQAGLVSNKTLLLNKKSNLDESMEIKPTVRKSTPKNLLNEIAKNESKDIKRAINTTVEPASKQNKSVNKSVSNASASITYKNKEEKVKKKLDSSSENEITNELDENYDFDEEEYGSYDDYDEEDDDYLDDDEDDADYEEPPRKKSNKRSFMPKNNHMTSVSNYVSILGKFYSRSQAPNSSLNNTNETESSSKRAKYSTKIPKDLAIGNYPAKCNVCNLILDNNIELTSHICSHLESGGSSNANTSNGSINDSNSYISPFDAVTTTCGVCDTTFDQPFDLIKHLDQKHMKQLNEYKCRICEKQHSKLSELIAHLNQTHVNQEMPYRCDACGFRTSFYADAIYHIKKEHKSTLRHFCPYCLKSLVLPYNEKQGYVQCNLFYSHLITHFNKHENDTLMQSKCKHCHKCILHVRYMKDHLCSDHSSNVSASSNNNVLTSSNTKPRKTLSESNNAIGIITSKANKPAAKLLNESISKKTELAKKQKITISSNKTAPSPTVFPSSMTTNKRNNTISISNTPANQNNSTNLRKRRRSTVSETIDSNSETPNPSNKEGIYEFDDDEINEKCDIKLLNEIIKTESMQLAETTQNGVSKVKGRRSSNSLSRSSTSKQQLVLPISKTIEETSNKRTRLSFTKNEVELAVLAGPPYKRKQKALKQTNVKKNPDVNKSQRTCRTPSFDESMKVLIQSLPVMPPKSVSSPEVITTMLAGNVRFNYNKNKFKCVECGDTDLKSHFRNDYTCHQCRYNTNCSNSFEYHLHGHLVSKRIALWNKVIKTTTEEYRCQCGFYINSTKDNNLNANTGNKVAAHLMKCEFKYCNVNIEEKLKLKDQVGVNGESLITKTKSNLDETIENVNEKSVESILN